MCRRRSRPWWAPFKADQLSASVSFLFGKGNIESEFTVHPADRNDVAQGTAMLLLPKREDPRLSKIYFVVDPVSAAVRESIVVDPSGNENRFDFTHIKANLGLAGEGFRRGAAQGHANDKDELANLGMIPAVASGPCAGLGGEAAMPEWRIESLARRSFRLNPYRNSDVGARPMSCTTASLAARPS